MQDHRGCVVFIRMGRRRWCPKEGTSRRLLQLTGAPGRDGPPVIAPQPDNWLGAVALLHLHHLLCSGPKSGSSCKCQPAVLFHSSWLHHSGCQQPPFHNHGQTCAWARTFRSSPWKTTRRATQWWESALQVHGPLTPKQPHLSLAPTSTCCVHTHRLGVAGGFAIRISRQAKLIRQGTEDSGTKKLLGCARRCRTGPAKAPSEMPSTPLNEIFLERR